MSCFVPDVQPSCLAVNQLLTPLGIPLTGPLSALYLGGGPTLTRRYVACFPEVEHPYDAVLDDYEPGMRTARG